ncbi:FAD-dependent monooxygenase [Pandoraea sp.]|uniref:FAD-dependent monooxygenase n=1 Tax=Pandoraea sp. TaxID=1883445 RepID=UPI0011FBEFB4|nr:FAD-dependent monooxygenase [Pandoraea sp.]TAL55101.1 MAG: salicylate hydroxylase [Pandoraea sp.]TAM19851.1 MAG: salicylate hydroxylase [Pandoraea sp.]
MASPLIGITGAGIGGLAAAIALRRLGFEVAVFEQAAQFARVGADINLTPNAVRALDGLGVGEALRETAAQPTYRISRMWDSGEVTSKLEMARAAEESYGAPQLTMHRADLMQALENALPAGVVHLGNKVSTVEQGRDSVGLAFADGTTHEVDVLIGADGIHSAVRTAMFGPEHPDFTGVVAYRAVVPAQRLAGVPNLDAFTKWWGPAPESQIVTFPLNRGRDIFIFATTPQDSWRHESWTTPGSVDELRAAYVDFHPEARALLEACDSVLKSALYVRDPLPVWSTGRVTLLGDACHPMMPFMAQGAGMAIEDAVVLSRHLSGVDLSTQASVSQALQRYEQSRRERTARVQIGSRGNNWLKAGGNADWVYAYDAWQVPLA